MYLLDFLRKNKLVFVRNWLDSLTPIIVSQPTPNGDPGVIPDLLARTPLTEPPLPYPAALIAAEATPPNVAADEPIAETKAAAAGLEPNGIG